MDAAREPLHRPPAPINRERRANRILAFLLHHPITKFLLLLASGFAFGLILGTLSTALLFMFLPHDFLNTAVAHRNAKVAEFIRVRRMCRVGDSAVMERYDAVNNVASICICVSSVGIGGMGRRGGLSSGPLLQCKNVELVGWGEEGSWGLGSLDDTG